MKVIIKNLNNGIKSVIINDPKTYNSLSYKTLGDLIRVFKKLDKDKNTKVIILEGAGNGFSAGHNLKEVRGHKNRSNHQRLFNLCSKLMLQIVEGNKPVIAKVHGAAYAAGCQLVASCDLAYSSNSAVFATPGVNIGLFCSTPMVAVSRKINRKHMMKMLLTGEPIKANFANEIGLINDYFPKNKPSNIPNGTGFNNVLNVNPLKLTPAFANANIGIIINATYGEIACSIFTSNEKSLSFILCGIVVANKTPAIVA